MRRVRGQLARLGAITAALFALNVGVPRSAVFFHSHPGGDHPHVHPDDDGAVELLAEFTGHHHHHHDHHHGDGGDWHQHATAAVHEHHAITADPTAPVALRHDDGPSTGHWHQQDHFQRALAVAPVLVATSAPVAWLCPAAPKPVARTAARDLRARGPPASPAHLNTV